MLVYGVRDARSLVYDAEFRSLARRHPGFAYRPVIGEAGGGSAGVVMQVTDALAAVGIDAGVIAFVAGGQSFIAAVRDALMARNLDRKAVKWERFW
jgi:phenol hydroxylase P5 protein